MGRFTPRFGPKSKLADSHVLYEGDLGIIHRASGRVQLAAYRKWNRSLAAIARQHSVTGLDIHVQAGRTGLSFLAELPALRQLTIHLPPNPKGIDWKPLDCMPHLEDLAINSFRDGQRLSSQGEPDLTKIESLVTCRLSPWQAAWASVLRCRNLRGLYILWENSGIKDFDLRALDKLTELSVGEMEKLASIQLGNRSRLKSLQLRRCRKLKIDWPRFGRDLEFLWIEGKPAYAYDELQGAPRLRGLMLSNASRIASAEFLRQLPKLEWLNLFLADFSEAGCQLIRSLKHLHVVGMKLPQSAQRSQGLFAANGWRSG